MNPKPKPPNPLFQHILVNVKLGLLGIYFLLTSSPSLDSFLRKNLVVVVYAALQLHSSHTLPQDRSRDHCIHCQMGLNSNSNTGAAVRFRSHQYIQLRAHNPRKSVLIDMIGGQGLGGAVVNTLP